MADTELAVTERYAQHHRLKGERNFELLQERYLRVQLRQFRTQQSYDLELALLDPDFERINAPATEWLGAMAIFILAAIPPIGYLYFHYNLHNLFGTLATLLLLSLMGTACLFLYRLNSVYTLTFRTRTARIPLVEILNHKAFRPGSLQFAEQIAAHSTQSCQQLRLSAEQLRAGELRMLRRLSGEGHIAPATYEQAKRMILASHQG